MNQRRQDWIEHPCRCQSDSYSVDGKCSEEVRHDNPMTLAGYLQQLGEPGEIVPEQQHRGAFARDVRCGADCDSNVGGYQRRRVIDPVTYHGHDVPGRLELAYALQLIFREQASLDAVN